MSYFDYDALDPGIRDTVRLLREAGFFTTDSGDGVSKPADWYESGCAIRTPHIYATAPLPMAFGEADRMQALLGDCWHVEASYSPKDGTCILMALAVAR